jgi:glycosyltransferase involved in cell wall biosynthesis
MRKIGVRTEVYTNREMALDLHNNDIVFFNSFAISYTTATTALDALKDGRIKKMFWYGHEDSPEGFFTKIIRNRVRDFLNEDKIEIFAVSDGTLTKYQKYFDTEKNITKMTFRFLLDEKYFVEKQIEDFAKIKFVSVGSLMDMRKGQYPILYAFLDFYHNFFAKNPEKYRDFEIDFIGAYNPADETDAAPYHIRNILEQFRESAKGLGKHVNIEPVMKHDAALKEIQKSNATICYSLREAMGIFVYEGMAMGHVVIRNETPGRKEQLNGNGVFVQNNDFSGLVNAIETLTNREKTSNEQLVKMSEKSVKIAKEATKNRYFIIDEIAKSFIKS